MNIKLLTKQHFECLSLKGGCTGSSESTHVKMPHCWKSHAMAQLSLLDTRSCDIFFYKNRQKYSFNKRHTFNSLTCSTATTESDKSDIFILTRTASFSVNQSENLFSSSAKACHLRRTSCRRSHCCSVQ